MMQKNDQPISGIHTIFRYSQKNQSQDLNHSKIELILKSHYNLDCKSIHPLPGYVDLNYKVECEKGNLYTLKISRPNTSEEWINLQSAVLNHITLQSLPFEVPSPVPDRYGAFSFTIDHSTDERRFVRLQQWLIGKPWANLPYISDSLLLELGATAAYLSNALKHFDHPDAHKEFSWDNFRLLDYESWTPYFTSEEQNELATYFFEQFKLQKDIIDKLPKQVCYNDLNDYNILTSTEKGISNISGIIDFGDAIYTQTVNELAIACAYAAMRFPDPLAACFHMVKGYHQIRPLSEDELSCLYVLIGARLVISVCWSSYNINQEPENKYLQISAEPAWKLLKQWKSIPPNFAYYRFREACDMEPCPMRKFYDDWARNHFNKINPPIDPAGKSISWLDLSIGSTTLGNRYNYMEIADFDKTIAQILKDKNADIGIGGYGEVRDFYTTDAYRQIGNQGNRWRTVHLGLDIWDSIGTEVCAFWDGEVVTAANHQVKRDYGGTIILKHQISETLTFYTLYGHLDYATFQYELGEKVRKGETLALLGNQEVNGEWPPHLHFQIILDILGNEDNYPGVAFPGESNTWLSICPPLDYFGKPDREDHKTIPELLEQRARQLGPNLSLSYQNPLHIIRGFKQYLFDHLGRRYLDTVNNVAHVGHEHPRVVRAGQRQIGLLNTNTRYLHQNILIYAEALLSTFSDPLEVCYFVNSGSEANELALRMARTYKQRQDIIAIETGYHGNTGNTIDISSYKFDQPGGAGKPKHTHLLPIPDMYRGEYADPKQAGIAYARSVDPILRELEEKNTHVAGFIAESILSCAGQIVLPENYLKEIYQKVRQAGGLCIADEVQVGFGRVGSHFWGFELSGVVPDIVTLGKPIGNGHPLGAVICTREVAEAFDNGMEYFNTYGGNPVSCAIGMEVLKVIEEENLQNNALHIGNTILNRLNQLKEQFPIIGDVRGTGLFLGFELVRNPETLEPADWEAHYLVNRMRALGYLMSTDGLYHNVIKIKPPLCIQREDVNGWMQMLEKVLQELKK